MYMINIWQHHIGVILDEPRLYAMREEPWNYQRGYLVITDFAVFNVMELIDLLLMYNEKK
jgi:hypothetical protein